ncbi:MAG: alternative ribosome rescue aminoacyl-tRNA hydrolase ArfB [Vicingaceae bacterium]
MKIREREIASELEFKFSRSGGKGGQHVNKTESRVSLFFDVDQSRQLSEEEKNRLRKGLSSRLSSEGVLQVDVEESRSQHKNKQLAIKQLFDMLERALRKKKKRKPTKPSKAAIRKRLREKKNRGEKKQNRRKDNLL